MVGLSLSIPDIAALQNGVSLAAPNAPTLALTSAATDNQPDFLVSAAAADLPIGATVFISAFKDVGLTVFEGTGSGTVSSAGTLTITNQLGPLTDGAKWFVAVTAIAGHAASARSNVQTETIDTTAPTLSSPIGTKTGGTTADLSASTNEGAGTLYGVVTTSSTPPSKAQVKAGQNNSGAAATVAFSQAVSATGAQTKSVTGLSGATTYTFHAMQEDAVGNQSNVSTSASFTTDASASATTLDEVNKGSGVTLTNTDTTATTVSDHWYAARSVATITGKKFFSVHIDALTFSIAIGVANASADPENANPSGTGFGSYQNSGGYWDNGSLSPGVFAGFAAGDDVDIAVDETARKEWISVNGGAFNGDPVAGTGGEAISATGALFAVVSLDVAGVTFKFASGSWPHAAPTGYTQI